MSAGLQKRSEVQVFENILAEKAASEREVEELRQKNAELALANEQLKQDVEDFEIFRPILETPVIDFYNVRLSGGPLMKQLLARMMKLYGPKFDLGTESKQARNVSRQMMANVVTACVRYCVMQNSRWADMVGHYLSGT